MKSSKLVLLVEDDRVDAMTVKRAMKEIGLFNPLQIMGGGEQALAYLRNPDNERPWIILLDLNMPRMNGIEFLKIIKQDAALRRIPVVILTTSKEEQDRVNSFDLSVAGYMIKPVDYAQFLEMMKVISDYWFLSESSG